MQNNICAFAAFLNINGCELSVRYLPAIFLDRALQFLKLYAEFVSWSTLRFLVIYTNE